MEVVYNLEEVVYNLEKVVYNLLEMVAQSAYDILDVMAHWIEEVTNDF